MVKQLFASTVQRIGLLGTALAVMLSVTPAQALSGSDFNPGRIIDDEVFFAHTAMTAGEVQDFLNSKVPVCDTNGDLPYAGTTRRAYSATRGYSPPFTCIKDYRQDIPNKSAESSLCGAIGASNRSAAEIISIVGTACGINPQVLITLIQKEQSLITDDWPWSIQYRSATGYGCPDTAACDSTYYGFFNQVYMAARQFKRYARDSHLYNYRAGQTSYVLYNPNASCGGSNITIQNQATANLYNYTPYQPNASALANLYGTGDSCGAYGNRNFWRLFNDWFGVVYSSAIGGQAYRLYHAGARNHYYTARENERAFAKQRAGYKDDGPVFSVSATQEAGMVPVYMHYNGRLVDHWLSIDGPSRYWAIVHGGYSDGGVAFYAYPPNAQGSPTPCSQGTPVYSLWHGGNTGHFLTTSQGERYWLIIHGGFIDDRSTYYHSPSGMAAFCAP